MYPKSTFANLRAKMFSMMYSFDTMELMVDFGLKGAPFGNLLGISGFNSDRLCDCNKILEILAKVETM